MILLPQKVAYRGTLTGLRISSVDGTAFLDNCAALVPYADGSHLVEIYDASGRMLRGYLAAAGTAETFDSDMVTNGAFTSDSGWNKETGWTINEGTGLAVVTGGVAGTAITQILTAIRGRLYKSKYDCKSADYLFSLKWGILLGALGGVGDNITEYFTSPYVDPQPFGLRHRGVGATPLTGTFDNLSLEQVLTPSTSGATIVSAKGGTTENFAYKNASFTFNQSSYQVIVRAAR